VSVYRFIAVEKAAHSIAIMCRVLEVSRSGYHAWTQRRLAPRALEDARLTERIRELHRKRRSVYGSPRIWSDLVLDDGERIGRKRVERLMRQAGLSGLITKKWRATTIRVPGVRVADDLLDRNFAAGAPNRCWVADITYLRTWEGWLYLVAVQDLYSRRIVGWAMADHLRAELVTDALGMALAHRRPAHGLIWHSDQGSPIRQSRLRTEGARRRDRAVDGQQGRLLRQRRRRELLRDGEEGADQPPHLAHEGRAAHRGFRLHRSLLQPREAPQHPRATLACRLREDQPPERA